MSTSYPYAVECIFGVQHIYDIARDLNIELTEEQATAFFNYYEDALLEAMNIAACNLVEQYLPEWGNKTACPCCEALNLDPNHLGYPSCCAAATTRYIEGLRRQIEEKENWG